LLRIWQLMQTCVLFCFSRQKVVTLKYFLNSDSPVRREVDARMICLSLLGVCNTNDDSSLSMVWRRWVIAVIGWNFVGGQGVEEVAIKLLIIGAAWDKVKQQMSCIVN